MKFTSNTATNVGDLAREFEKYRNGRHPKGVKYPEILRRKLLLAIDQGLPAEEVLKLAGIQGSTLGRWRRQEGEQKLSKRRLPIAVDGLKCEPLKGGSGPCSFVMPKISLPSGIVIELPLEMLGEAIAVLNGSQSC